MLNLLLEHKISSEEEHFVLFQALALCHFFHEALLGCAFSYELQAL